MINIKWNQFSRWLVPAIALSSLIGCGGGTSTSSSSSSTSSTSSSSSTSSTSSSSSSSSSSSTSSTSSSSSSSSSGISLPLVVAIDAGSSSSTTLNGVEYQADKYASGGSTGNTTDTVSGGKLYQTERYGSFSYEIPVTANGRYTVVLHFAEIYQTKAGARSFGVAIEENNVISNLDLYAKVGQDVGYTETFADIDVVDKKVTIEMIKGVDSPTIAGFAIYSSDGKLDTTIVPATNFSKYSAYTKKYTEKTVINSNHATGHVGDFFFTHWKDGGSTSLTMEPNGAFNVTWQGGGYNYVGGPGWHYGDVNRVVGYRLNEESGASYIALYGWGYDKTLPSSNTARLVEYYVLQRWTFDPASSATRGTTFTSNGVQYTTYRSTRQSKPSINGTATFYQYWSKPAQQQPLGQDNKIIFADHVKAWAASGWTLPNMNNIDASDDPTYQVIAVEVFNPGSSGKASGRVWDATAQ
jgi:hypothetical protein